MRTFLRGFMLLAIVGCSSCGEYNAEPERRPKGVPPEAVWAGGPDGGSYVWCKIDQIQSSNYCKVWNDFNGHLIESGNYRILGQDRAAGMEELVYGGASRGGQIWLKNGLTLQKVDPTSK
jgi:hypothetical protein